MATERSRTRKLSEIATSFVNLDEKRAGDFLKKYVKDIRPRARHVGALLEIAGQLRRCWRTQERWGAESYIAEIFSGRLAENLKRLPVGIQEPNWMIDDDPAFLIRLGSDRPVFKRRDVIDDIAHTILAASVVPRNAKHNLLRICEGSRQGWRCPTRYLVADENRRRYCYKSCGDQAKSEAKKQRWARLKREKRVQ